MDGEQKGLRIDMADAKVQIAVLGATLILYLISNALLKGGPLALLPPFIGIMIVVEMLFFVGLEVRQGADKNGWKHELLDTVMALVVAIAIWYGASFLLNTSSPISAVVSCSMLPNLQRGDFVVVQGADVRAHEISMSQAQLDSLSDPAIVRFDGKQASVPGSLYTYCRIKNDEMCRAFYLDPSSFVEIKGPLEFRYEVCSLERQGEEAIKQPCLRSVSYEGKEYLADFSNDVIVYAPQAGDPYAYFGDIVHRVFFKIDADGQTYYLTKGDNNPVLDLQVHDYASGQGNKPIPQSNTRGKVLARIPLLGYFKLFLSGFLHEDAQCSTQLTYTHR